MCKIGIKNWTDRPLIDNGDHWEKRRPFDDLQKAAQKGDLNEVNELFNAHSELMTHDTVQEGYGYALCCAAR